MAFDEELVATYCLCDFGNEVTLQLFVPHFLHMLNLNKSQFPLSTL